MPRPSPTAAALAFLLAAAAPSSPSAQDEENAGSGLALAEIAGVLVTEDETPLAPDSVATVTLADVSRADAPSRTIAELRLETGEEREAIPFGLAVAPDLLQPRRRYSLRGTVSTPEGTLLWTTDTAHPVEAGAGRTDLGTLTMVKVARPDPAPGALAYLCGDTAVEIVPQGEGARLTVAGESIDLARVPTASGARFESADGTVGFWMRGTRAMLERDEGASPECRRVEPADEPETDAAADPDALRGGEWTVERVAGRRMVGATPGTLAFGEDGRISGSTGCNRFNGTYEAGRDGSLSLGPVAATKRACLPPLDRQEAFFLAVLNGAETFEISPEGVLVVSAADGTMLEARRK